MRSPSYHGWSYQGLLVMRRFLLEDPRRLCGSDFLSRSDTPLASGSLYPMLKRLERDGLLSSEPEPGDASQLGRPLRQFYWLTTAGRDAVRDALTSLKMER